MRQIRPLLQAAVDAPAARAREGERQATLHERLREAMNESFGSLFEIPLQVAQQTRAVIDAQHRLDPGAAARQDLARGVMEIEQPDKSLGAVGAGSKGPMIE